AGMFGTGQHYTINLRSQNVSERPNGIIAGDFNGDGKLDLVVAEDLGLVRLLGNGDGTFQAPSTISSSFGLGTLAAGDFNGDSQVDIMTADRSTDASGTATLGLLTLNVPPVANNQHVSTNEDTAKTITLTGNDTESEPLTFTVTSAPVHGTLSGAAPNLSYT